MKKNHWFHLFVVRLLKIHFFLPIPVISYENYIIYRVFLISHFLFNEFYRNYTKSFSLRNNFLNTFSSWVMTYVYGISYLFLHFSPNVMLENDLFQLSQLFVCVFPYGWRIYSIQVHMQIVYFFLSTAGRSPNMK